MAVGYRRLGCLLVAAAALAVVSAGCGAGGVSGSLPPAQGDRPGHYSGAHEAVPQSLAPATTSDPRVGRPYPVGTRTGTLVDPTRPVGPAHSLDGKTGPRVLRIDVYYPATRAPAATAAPPRPASGRFPLVVFAPGYDEYTATYTALLDAWAQAGYVVAAVDFPLTNPATPGGPDESDIVNQPGDLRLVIDRVAAAPGSVLGPIAAVTDTSEVALAGHSDGAEAAAAVAFDSCCQDRRVDAAVIMAGSELPMGTGSYFPAPGPPLLAIQGSADRVNPPAGMADLYAADRSTRFFLSLAGADHLGPFDGTGPAAAVVEAVTVDFLDAELRHDPRGVARMKAAVRTDPQARLIGS